jgi:hypothetical protein
VIIGFMNPPTCLISREFAKSKWLVTVVGTAGFNPYQMEKIREIRKGVRYIFSPNMSMGINVMFRIVREVALVLDLLAERDPIGLIENRLINPLTNPVGLGAFGLRLFRLGGFQLPKRTKLSPK